MGGQNQPVSSETQSENPLEAPTSKHSRFTQATIIKSKDDNLYFEVSQSIGNLSTFTQWQKKITNLKKNIGPHSLLFPLECQYQQQGLCGTSGILKFKFQYFAFLLDEEIMNRQLQNQPFQQKQIWFLLYILTQTAAQLHKENFLVGDIHPKNIFINHSGDISVFSMHSFPEDFTNFQKVLYFKETNYLPPEGVNDIQTGKQIPTYDEKLGQSFSVGLTILSAIFLTDFSFLYDKMERFNEIAFLKILSTLKEYQISQKLKEVICSLLQINPQKRMTCTALHKYLSPYQKQIFELQPFEIANEIVIQQKSQKDFTPTRNSQKIHTESKRQSLNKTISLNGSAKKNSVQKTPKMELNSKVGTKNKQESSLNNIFTEKLLPFNIQPSSLSNEASLATFKHLQKPSETMLTSLKSQESQQLISFQKITQTQIIENNLINEKPQTLKEHELKSDMTFKTGQLFRRQKSATSVLLNENLLSSKIRPNLIQNLIQSRKFDFTETSYQNNYEFDNYLKKKEHQFSTNLSSDSKSNSDEFLKNIERQIQESRRMFPDSMK